MARSYPKRSTTAQRRGGGRPRRSTGDLATVGTNNENNNDHHDENDNDNYYHCHDFVENAKDGDNAVVSFLPSSNAWVAANNNLPKRRRTNTPSSHSATATTLTNIHNQRWVKVHRRPTAPTDEIYFGSSPFASFTVPTWVKMQDLTEEERTVYDNNNKNNNININNKLKEEKRNYYTNNSNATKSQAGERESCGNNYIDDAVAAEVVVMPSSATGTESGEIAAAPIDEKEVTKHHHETPSDSAVCAVPSERTGNDAAIAVEGTNGTSSMTMNLEEMKEDKGEERDAVVEVSMDSSLPMVAGEGTSNLMEMVDDNNHDNKDEINSNDHGGNDEENDEEKGEDDEEFEEEQDNEDEGREAS